VAGRCRLGLDPPARHGESHEGCVVRRGLVPDGRWLAYAKSLPNNNRALYLRHVTEGPSYALTSGEVDTGSPKFDPDGGRLYFLASGNAAPAEAFGMYPAVLRPLILRRIQAARIDLSQSPAGLRRSLDPASFAGRVRTLPFEARDYEAIEVLTDSTLLASARQWPATPGQENPTLALFRLDARSPQAPPIAADIGQFAVSPDRKSLLVDVGDSGPCAPAVGRRGHDLHARRHPALVDPRAEWRQIYREAWRVMRDTFYDPKHHGQDVAASSGTMHATCPASPGART
jgi:tricorn protease